MRFLSSMSVHEVCCTIREKIGSDEKDRSGWGIVYGERFLRKDRTLEYYDLQNGVRERDNERSRYRETQIHRDSDTERDERLRERH